MPAAAQAVGIAVVLSGDGDRCLVGARPADVPLGGCLEFPGGKCLPDESPCDAAVRECLEESGIAVEPLRRLSRRTHDYDHGRVTLHFWLCRPVDEHPAPPSEPFCWYATSDLDAGRFPEANTEVISQLVSPRSLDWLTDGDQTASTHDS